MKSDIFLITFSYKTYYITDKFYETVVEAGKHYKY